MSTYLKIYIKDGVDGSGLHAIYLQENDAQTHNVIMYMFFCSLDNGTLARLYLK